MPKTYLIKINYFLKKIASQLFHRLQKKQTIFEEN